MNTQNVRFFRFALIAAAVLIASAGALTAGPLTPPAGPVTSTNKTLQEVEPRIAINSVNTPGDANSAFVISQSGSYYFAGNLTGQSAKHGIRLNAPNITIDLNGFSLIGVAGSFNAFTAGGALSSNVTVRNGIVRSWGNGGVHLVDQVGSRSIVQNIHAIGNGWDGINVGQDSTVENCISEGNGQNGIRVASGSVVRGCIAKSNAEAGFRLGIASRATDCVANNNNLQGIDASFNCVLSGITAYTNTGAGIDIGAGSVLTASASYLNSGNGITASTGCVVRDCSATNNTGNGIIVGSGSRVESCLTRSNGSSGISAASGCSIINNTCTNNGAGVAVGAGIVITGSDNRIEGNNCVTQDIGIDVSAGGNIIIRNTCAGNATNWTIAANNYYGPIINRVGAATAAVTGNSAVSTLSSTDANANFSY